MVVATVSETMKQVDLCLDKELILESGNTFSPLKYRYHIAGEIKPDKKIIWVVHALTGSSNVYEWWPGLFGTKDFFNEEDYTIICVNNFGSCYGASCPTTIETNPEKYNYNDFPFYTVRDSVKYLEILRTHLEIEKIDLLVGGSIGGMMCMEWAYEKPTVFKSMVLGATTAEQLPWAIAINETQRMAIRADQSFGEPTPTAAQRGLEAARGVALISYRSYDIYNKTQADNNEVFNDFKASSYQRYQGEKMSNRFDVYSYYRMTEAMDSHNIGRGRSSKEKALANILCPTLILGFTTDILFPTIEQKFLAKYIPNSAYLEVETEYGHDGFLIETKTIAGHIKNFLEENI